MNDDDGAARPRRIPPTVVPGTAVRRLGVRVLDPSTAVRADGRALEPTAYVGDVLLVRGVEGWSADAPLALLREAAKGAGYAVEPVPDRARTSFARRRDLLEQLDAVGHTAVRLVPT